MVERERGQAGTGGPRLRGDTSARSVVAPNAGSVAAACGSFRSSYSRGRVSTESFVVGLNTHSRSSRTSFDCSFST